MPTKKKLLIKRKFVTKNNKIMIDDQEVATKSVLPQIQYKLNRIFKRNVNIVELPETLKMIDLCIGPFARKFLKSRVKFYKCDVITRRARRLRNHKIKDIGKTVGEIFDVLLNNNIMVHLHGGIIRDFFIGVKSS